MKNAGRLERKDLESKEEYNKDHRGFSITKGYVYKRERIV